MGEEVAHPVTQSIPVVSKKKLSDSTIFVSAKQAADYNTTTKFCINNIKKTFIFSNDNW
jgi:hypothetical protein